MYYELVFKALNHHKVAYLVAGGMAVNLHGIPRFTKDLDLLVDESKKNLEKLTIVLKELGYKPKVPVKLEEYLNPENWRKWHKEKGMLAVNFHNPKKPFEEIDLLVHVDLKFPEAKKHKKSITAGTTKVHVVSIDDLIQMKQKAGRQQDMADIESLKKLKTMLKLK